MRYIVLAEDEQRFGNDGSPFVRAIEVRAESEAEAWDKAKPIADLLGLQMCAKHDGTAVYELIDASEPLEAFVASRQRLLEAEAAQKERTRLASLEYQKNKVGDRA